jgi:N-acetylmuramic acid 6-phosphate etherase
MSKKDNTNEVKSPAELAKTFLAQSSHFQLGHLPTESRHPKTTRLSQLACGDRQSLEQAISLLKEVELDAMQALPRVLPRINEMRESIVQTFASGGRVFLCGCGATGRLSLSLETLWREEMNHRGMLEMLDSVVSFMAGADYAMVRSIENFEDHPEYGARQLHDLGFTANDLLIGTTEGGETPFVIGAIEEASRVSHRHPYMIYCNPSDLLVKTVERSRRAIENPKIKAFAIETGPMALAGSTRLQATTALMLATGAALFSAVENSNPPEKFINEFTTDLKNCDLRGLAPLIEAEAAVYSSGGYCIHKASKHAITVLTDTTERSPTFSLQPFESTLHSEQPLSWTYLIHAEANSADEAWRKILGRNPRALAWEGFRDRFGEGELHGFDFSTNTEERRRNRAGSKDLAVYEIEGSNSEITLRIKGLEARLPRPASLLCEHLLLKIAMNISSTLAMGRMGRFSSNLMLYVRAANNKLVDRAIRYIKILLEDAGIKQFTYEQVCLALYETTAGLAPDEPAVLRTFEHLKKQTVSFN